MQISRLSLLSLLATATAGSRLQYDIPDELFALFGLGGSDSSSTASSSSSSAAATGSSSTSHSASSTSSSSSSSSCYYPAEFTLDHFASWSPASNSSISYVSFIFSDNGTQITTPCSYNSTSTSLTAGTQLAARYACDNDVVSFIWQSGKLTAIEATCPGQTATQFEASGSVTLAGSLQCSSTNCTSQTDLSTGTGKGQLCKAAGPLSANFTSQEPSPL